ncbi:uncharacterized protein PHACADRAFT_264400 [Phanerochaete carnosa HHB-10118-sp]|uniref:Uncharacterized protein n=1 Tax=Phanerochaete carnosa (strain HHB-10118-sp) TaxID=650164 RepID=K5VTQ6_PHACS|nr:uncharacterized protein PHACADRAFT_264400 [Phanerochaete carnosa HHB-10118-sp]EKM49944.1 hypothetical protein PHACADRAFT_264400 [Phanerochaete carnosa HHB-10118-sp]
MDAPVSKRPRNSKRSVSPSVPETEEADIEKGVDQPGSETSSVTVPESWLNLAPEPDITVCCSPCMLFSMISFLTDLTDTHNVCSY